MRDFSSSAEVYETLGSFIVQASSSGGFGPMLLQTGQSVQFDLSEPEAAILLRPTGSAIETLLGQTDPAATAHLTLASGTLHRIFLSQDSFSAAVDRQDLMVSDGVRELIPLLAPLSFAAFPRYGDFLRDLGKEDLL